jgi:KDO2-lipid IV(A) lauroyltransferase
LKFLAGKIFRYRKVVVENNLKGSFPNKTNAEINRIVSLFYKNLADNIIEGIKAFTMTKAQIRKRHKIVNPELLEPYFSSGQSIIGVTGHYANWEWGSLSASLQIKQNVVAFYKPLSNKYIDRFVRWSRTRFGTTLASINETSDTFEKLKDTPTIFLFASDQGMPSYLLHKAHWVNFLNRETPFLYGVEKYSKLYDFPVIFIDIQRVKRGFYEVELSVLVDNPKFYSDAVITQMYASKLEKVINKKPEDWLWSHKRWRYTRTEIENRKKES